MKRTIEQLADLRCRIHEQQHQRELSDQAAREKALQQNKADITATTPLAAPQPAKTFSFTIKR